MRVLLISHTCQSTTEGQPKAEILGAMPDVDLHVLVPDRWYHYGAWRQAEAPAEASFHLHVEKVRLPWTGPGQWYLHHYPHLKNLLLDLKPDIIDLWEEPWSLVSAQTVWLRNRYLPGTRIVSETEQNIDKHLPPPFESFRNYTLRHCDYAIARNREALEILRRKGYTGPGKVVPNAVDERLFYPRDSGACKKSLGFAGFCVGYVGRLVPEKGLMDLLAALSHTSAETRLVLVGDGPLEPNLRQQVREQVLGERVTFMGPQPLEKLPEVMNALDVLVLPSRTTARWKEQFGRVIIEAHACGIPVIGSDSGAIPEVIGEGGLVFPEGDAVGLAAAVEQYHRSEPLRREHGERGRTQVLEKYTWSAVARAMHEVYRQVQAANYPELV